MARLQTSGFEIGLTSTGAGQQLDGGNISGAASIDATTKRSGLSSLKCDSAAGAGANVFTVPAASVAVGVTVFTRIYVLTTATPTAATSILSLSFGGGSYNTYLRTDGKVELRDNGDVTVGSPSATVVNDGSWYRIEVAQRLAASTNDDYLELLLDGTSVASTTTANQGTGTAAVNITVGWVTSPGASRVIWYDDFAVNDSTGSAQTSWPGAGSVVLLRPTADSAVGTGWTLGNTTATGGNAWQRLDSAPPDSAADLTTAADADQIRNASSNANVSYDATMTTYTAAGMGASDAVNVVVPIIATGAPVTTSAKAGTVGVVSNPAIANIALGAGGTSGAFWSGAGMGTYPTGNKWSFGTTTYAPTVTLGTAPVMRVTQVTASTRIAIVSEMGIYVDYTPAAATLPPLPVYVDSAVARSTSY